MSSSPRISLASPHQRYEVGELLGQGGMGVIHRAYDRLANRDVAFKRLTVHSERDRPRLTALFQREYDTLARLEHPNIVAAYDYGFEESGPYYVMELLPGEDLAKLAPVSWRECCRLLRDVASALALIHARRLIHRDVSPNNVRISKTGHAKLLDFGALTSFGVPTEVIGTPAFMAPESANGEPLDQRSDLYSLGALAYWTLTRRLAFRAFSLDDLRREWAVPVVAPSTYDPSIPAALEELVLSLLKADKAGRPPAAADVIERLATIAELEPEQNEERVGLSYLEHTPLSGRAEINRVLRSALDLVSSGSGSIVMIDGGPGMGRSAVLEHLGIQAQLQGNTVLRAEGKVNTGSLGLMTHLARTAVATYPSAAQLEGRPPSSPAPLVEPVSTEPRTPIESAERYAARTASLREVLWQTAARGPVVILVDDADFADEPSLDVLAAMSETIARTSILLVLTRLSGAAPINSLGMLSAHATVSSLAPLSRDAVAELASNIFGDVRNVRRVADWLFEEAGGAPASCIELVRALLLQRSVQYVRGTFLLPSALEPGQAREAVRGSVVRAAECLDAHALRIARALGVSDKPLRLEQLQRATGLLAPEVFAGLAQLLELRLLLESGGDYTITNQSFRAIITEALSTEDTRRLNLALARIIEAEPNPTLLDRYASGLYLIRAGGEHAFQGAMAIAKAARVRNYDLSLSAPAIPFLEAALAVFRERGTPDHELLDLLAPLTVAGFYGDLTAQRRHLPATMHALYKVAGLAVATRLQRWMNARLALILGILWAALWRLLRPSKMRKRSVAEDIESVLNVACTATASAGCIAEEEEAAYGAGFLEPFAQTSAGSAMQIARQYCLAIADAGAGKFASSAARFRGVLQALEVPVRGVEERVRQQLRSGCLNGLMQVQIELDPRKALEAAGQLALQGAFFAPHAELGSTMYHGLRGELGAHERHRRRTEALALPGGLSWSALTLMTMREHQCATLSGNTNSLARASAELQRLASFGATVQLLSELSQADLLVLRGRAHDAVPVYARIFAARQATHAFHLMSLTLYARALREIGQVERARTFCEENLTRLATKGDLAAMPAYRQLIQQLALAQAELGMVERAQIALDEQLAVVAQAELNPLMLGSLERDRARVAIIAGDAVRFEQSFAEMKRWFQATQNPWLLQQCDALVASAVRTGLRVAQSHERDVAHVVDDLDGSTDVGPADTQLGKHNAVRASSLTADPSPSEPPPRTARG